jgi:hypothetical protein
MRFILSMLAVFMLASCAQKNIPAASQTNTAVPLAVLAFDSTQYNFGTVAAGANVNCELHFTNTGNAPLVISHIPCPYGNAMPSWPTEPIPPGGSGVITFKLDTHGKYGPLQFTFTVKSNSRDGDINVHLKGKVMAPAESAPGKG